MIRFKESAILAGIGLSSLLMPAVRAQEPNPCALLIEDEIKPLAAPATVAPGVSTSFPSLRYASCRYVWGEGIDRAHLAVIVAEPSRQFAGLSPDQIKQRLLESVRPDTDDAIVAEVGDAAVFRPESVVYATATAVVKGRVLRVELDGRDAQNHKGAIIALLKSAAARM